MAYAQFAAFPAHCLVIVGILALTPSHRVFIGSYDLTARGKVSISNYIFHQYFTFVASYLGLYDSFSYWRLVVAVACVMAGVQVFCHRWFYSVATYVLAPPVGSLIFGD